MRKRIEGWLREEGQWFLQTRLGLVRGREDRRGSASLAYLHQKIRAQAMTDPKETATKIGSQKGARR